jgi:hypothetical protein
VNVSGWSFNHESDAAKKGDWTFPEGSVLAAGAQIVVANSAQEYRKANGKNPDFELNDGSSEGDDESVPNLAAAEGAGVIRSTSEPGALTLRDAQGALKSHIGFRPEPTPHIAEEQNKWNEIPLDIDGESAPGSEAEKSPDDPGVSAVKPVTKLTGKAPSTTAAAGAGSSGAEASPVRAAAKVDQAQNGVPTEERSMLWLSFLLAAVLAGGFVWARRR